MTSGVCHDPERLHPAFRARVDLVLSDMRSAGWRPVIWETFRTQERGAMLRAKGTSNNGARSIHCYADDQGYVGAVDIVDADLDNVPKVDKEGLWHAPAEFWRDLKEFGRRHGLYEFDADKPHLQCLPCKQYAQNAYRALTPRARGEFIARVCAL